MTTLRTTPATAPGLPDGPVVLLATAATEDLREGQFDVLVEQVRQRGWRLLDFGLIPGSFPEEQSPAGALTTILPTHPLVTPLRERRIPTVRVGRLDHPDDPSVPAVLPDYVHAGRMAADHFAERGFGDLALFGHEGMVLAPLVQAGLQERAEGRGCTCHQHLVGEIDQGATEARSDVEWHDQRSAGIAAWLGALPKPVGVVACNSYHAGMLGVICQRSGFSVPEDVAILSVGNERTICELASVPISAIELDRANMMRVAIELLDQMIEGQDVAARTYVPPTRIVTRRSTDILAVPDPLVARAIRYLWDRLDQEVSVDDVAMAMRTPRYKLERLFRKHYKRGIHAELRRVRLARFAELLRNTDLPVRELAPRVGYNTARLLHDAFSKEYGMTPGQYRKRAKRGGDT